MKMKNYIFRKGLAVSIILLFVGASIVSGINVNFSDYNGIQTTNVYGDVESKNNTVLTFHTFDDTGTQQHDLTLSDGDAKYIFDVLEELKYKIVYEPRSEETQELKIEFVDLLDSYGLIPEGLSKEDVLSMLNPSWLNNKQKTTEVRTRARLLRSFTSRITEKIAYLQQIFKNRFGKTNPSIVDNNPLIFSSGSEVGTATFCSIASGGDGATLPLFVLPRPRGAAVWSASLAVTLVGELITGKGFIAGGAQSGTALGFMGLGLTYALPGYTMYGFVGYALYTKVNAESIEYYEPPNQVPIVSDENPANGESDVLVTLPELSFRISDPEGDLMDYTVTTEPDIGSGSGNNKNNGVYKVPINGLNENTEYTWHVIVDDEYNTVEKEFTFTTETVAPIISDPTPEDDENYVSPEITQLSFRLSDNQGDLMDYTVHTDPYIGYGSGNNVGNGIHTVDISGLDYTTEYTWTVEATDGTYWAEEVFNFKTLPIMEFDPFDEGWQYRKKITINHNKVTDDLIDFPVLVNVIDSDLKNKAQNDGDDILFMDDVGVANRLYHEIEYYNGNNGELVAWVKIPDLDDNSDTILYMYYGNPSCGDQQNPEWVWDNNFVMVQHMVGYDNMIFDSTINNNDGTIYGAISTTGSIGSALHFDGDNDYVSCAPNIVFDMDFPVTLDAWIYKEPGGGNQGNGYDGIICTDRFSNLYSGYRISLLGKQGDLYTFGAEFGDGNGLGETHRRGKVKRYIIEPYNYYKLTSVIKGPNDINLFINGQDLADEYIGEANTVGYKGGPCVIGNSWYLDYNFHGMIDEVRVSNTARSSDWISTEYNNQNDPSDFLSFGPEET